MFDLALSRHEYVFKNSHVEVSEGRSPVVETFFHSSTLACCRVELRANIEKFDMSNIFGL